MTLNLAGGRRLVLAGMASAPLWTVAGLLVLGLLLLLYRYERRLVSRRTGLALLVLRLAAAVALVASLFEPVIERIRREPVRGRVIVGVDHSGSMETADVGPGGRSRRWAAGELLAGRWLRQLQDQSDVEAMAFAREPAAGTPAEVARLLAGPSVDGEATDWEPVLEAALAGSDAAPTLGVVLLTDGRSNVRPTHQPAIERLRERGVPIFPVLVGSTRPPRDVAVAAVKMPETVDRGQTARIDVTIKADGLSPGTEIPVTLERAGETPQRQMVRVQADGGRPVVTFRVPFESVGEQELTVAAGPVADDTRSDNDRKPLRVVVADDKARVLIVEGEARWEFQYLRNALMRDPRVTLEAIVLRQPALPGNEQRLYPRELPPRSEPASAGAASASPDPLNAFDAIIVGDVGASGLDAGAWRRLESYAAERGGTLVLAAGPRTYPALAEEETVRKLLPVRSTRVVPVNGTATDPRRPALPAGLALLPTATATTGPWPMFQLAEDAESSRSVWDTLPHLPWMIAGPPKPTATALAGAGEAASGDDEAVLAVMPYGLGKVFWVGTDGTWRWRFRIGDAHHHRFWGQLVQWAARGKLSSGNRLVQFGGVPPRVADGEPLVLRARFTEPGPVAEGSLLVAAKLYRVEVSDATHQTPTGDPVAVIPLRPRADQPRVFDGTVPRLPPGRYVARLEVPQMTEALQAVGGEPLAAVEVLPRETSEQIELAATREPLEELARATGGRVLSPHEVDSLPKVIQARSTTRIRIEPTRLAERPELLLLFFALMTTEWVLRKRAGLP